MRSYVTLVLLLFCTSVLMSCASKLKKKAEDDSVGIKVHSDDSIARQSLKKAQSGVLSPMDKKVFSARNAYSTSTFHTKDFTGTKAFTGAGGTYKTKEFAQSGKKDGFAEKKFATADEKSKLAEKSFATKDSPYNGRGSNYAEKSFAKGSEKYHTQDDPLAEKAAKKAVKPLLTGDTGKSLTEEDVRKMLNKQ